MGDLIIQAAEGCDDDSPFEYLFIVIGDMRCQEKGKVGLKSSDPITQRKCREGSQSNVMSTPGVCCMFWFRRQGGVT